jgi:RNA polymerase sigma-70 factor (ECF subfamily)
MLQPEIWRATKPELLLDGHGRRSTTPRTGEAVTITEPSHVEAKPTAASDAATPPAAGRSSDGHEQILSFVRGAYPQVVATVALWTGSIDDAADAVADALGRAWEKIDRGQPVDNLAAFVTTAAMNRLRTQAHRRALFRRKRHLLTDDVSVDPSDASDRRIDLAAALATLTPRQRTMIALRYGSDLSIADTAAFLGLAEGTVKATLHQVRAALAERLEPQRGAPDD